MPSWSNTTKVVWYITILLIGISVYSCSDRNNSSYKVKGTLKGITDDYFYAAREVGDSLIIDTVSVDKNGKFSFSGDVDTLTVVSLYFNKNTKMSYVFVDKGWSVNMNGDVKYPDLIKSKGGDINNDLTSFKEKNEELLTDRAKIIHHLQFCSQKDSTLNSNYIDLQSKTFVLANIAENYVKENPSKIASVMLINSFFKDDSTIPRLDENIKLLEGKARTFPLTVALKQYSRKVRSSAVGAVAPNFSVVATNGKTTNLYDYRGKYLLIAFASTTCDECNVDKDLTIDIYHQLLKEKVNVEFITVVTDTEIRPLDKKIEMTWRVITENGGWNSHLVNLFNIKVMPYGVLISPKGIILARDVPTLDIPRIIKEEIEKEKELQKS